MPLKGYTIYYRRTFYPTYPVDGFFYFWQFDYEYSLLRQEPFNARRFGAVSQVASESLVESHLWIPGSLFL